MEGLKGLGLFAVLAIVGLCMIADGKLAPCYRPMLAPAGPRDNELERRMRQWGLPERETRPKPRRDELH